jgi:hypothetical protein
MEAAVTFETSMTILRRHNLGHLNLNRRIIWKRKRKKEICKSVVLKNRLLFIFLNYMTGRATLRRDSLSFHDLYCSTAGLGQRSDVKTQKKALSGASSGEEEGDRR